MLGFFRRIINSKVGIVVTFIVLGVIALAFAAGDVTGLRVSGIGGSSVAKIGGIAVTDAQLTKQVQSELRGLQQQNPQVDMAAFVANNGVEGVLDRMVNGLALQRYGEQQGMVVSPALVGSQLQNIPALRGPTGKFDQTVYEGVLQRNKLTDAEVQGDIARETMVQFLLAPHIGASQVPGTLALPYASLLLEKRAGEVAFIPTAAMPQGAAPTDQELQAWYGRNIARYTVPERRVIRYARVSVDQVKAQATPSDADIAQAYNADKSRWAAKETRTVSLVTVLDQAAANALAGKIKGGASVTDAARAAGLEARTIGDAEKAALAKQTSAAVADAAFGAAKGAVIGPVRGTIGFVVARIDDVKQVAGKSLADARAEILPVLTKQKTAEAIGKLHDALDEAITGNANFGELVADQKLTAQATPPLTAAGLNPDDAAAKPDLTLAPIVNAGFQAEEGDDPQLVQTAPDGTFAVVALDRIVRAAPRPLAQVRDAVAKDVAIDRARRAARTAASAVLARVNGGAALQQAVGASGVRAPGIKPIVASRSQLAANPQGVDPTLALLFSMAGGTAKMLEAPNNAGWLIVKLNQITPGDAKKMPGVVNATRADLGRVVGREYAQQFTQAIKAAMKVQSNPAELAKVKADLTGQGGSDQQ